jgi:hypothetical protein
MKFGSMKEVLLTKARDIFLFDCQVAGLDPQALRVFIDVLTSFIRFTGDIRVKELTPGHVRLYIANLSDGPNEGQEHIRLAMNHYAVIHTWIRWLVAQKFIIERSQGDVGPPRLTNLFPDLRDEEPDRAAVLALEI